MIDLKWKRLGALDATLIAQLLKCNRSCTKLDLAWNSELCSAGSTGAIDLAEALAANAPMTAWADRMGAELKDYIAARRPGTV